MRRPSLRTFAAAALIAGLLLAALASWGSSRLQARAEAELVRALSEVSGARASLKSLELSLARGVLVARGVELRDGSRRLLEARELRGQISLGAAYTGRLQLLSLALTGVRAELTPADLARFGGELDGPALQRLQLPAADVTIDFGSAGALAFPRADLELSRERGQRTLALARTAAYWRLDGRTIARAELALRCGLPGTPGATIDCTPAVSALSLGQRTLAPPTQIELRWSVTQRRLAARLRLEQAALEGTLDGSGALQLTARDLRLPGLSIAQLTAAGELRLEQQRLSAERLRLTLPHGELRGRAELGAGGELALDLSSEALDLADLSPLAGARVEGRGRVQVRVRPGADAPALAATLALEAAAVGGVKLGRLAAELALERDGSRLRIERAQAISPERQLSTSGAELEFDAAGLRAAQAELKVERLPLAELYRSIGAGSDPMLAQLQGRSAGSASLRYRRTGDAHGLELDLSLQLTAASLVDYPFERGQLRARLALPDARAGVAAGLLTLSQLALVAGGGELELAGTLDRGALALRLATRGKGALPLASWPWLRAHAPRFGGGLSLHGALSGTASRPRAELQLEIDSLAFRGEKLGPVALAATLADQPSAADCAPRSAGRAWQLCGRGLAGQLRVAVAVSDTPERAVRGEIELERLALAPFLPPSAAGKPTSGVLSATLAFDGGGLAQPDRISGSARVRELAIGEADRRLASSAPFVLRADAGRLTLRDAVIQGREARFGLSAAGSLGNKPRLIAEGTLAAGVFTRTTEPFVKAFGDVALRLEWSFTETPAVTGRVDVRDLVVRAGSTQLRNLRGALAVAGERVTVEDVAAELGGGRLSVSGKLGLAGLRLASYDLALNAQGVSFAPEPLIDVALDAQNRLRWSGGAALPELTGHVKLKRVSVRKQLHPESLAALGSRRLESSGTDRLRLDLTVDHESPLQIRNSLIDGELSTAGADRTFRVVGSDRRLGLIGELAVTRGRLLFQGDEFQVQRGTIAFRDPKRIAPKFELLAVAERPRRPEAKVVLSARGTDAAFDVDVRCAAPEPSAPLPPFQCHYRGARMACDDLDQLVAQFVCKRPAR